MNIFNYTISLIFFLALSHVISAAQNAGILPYAYKDDIAYFLLGLEKRSWDSGKWTQRATTKWVWTDFGGGCNDQSDAKNATKYINIDQAAYCAARECTEETHSFYGNNRTIQDAHENSKEFEISIARWIIGIKKANFKLESSYYTEFFAEIDFFDGTQIPMMRVHGTMEKTDFRWFKVQDILDLVNEPAIGGFYRIKNLKIISLSGPSDHERADANKLFPKLAKTLKNKDVQDFINDTILAKEKELQKQKELSNLNQQLFTLQKRLEKLTLLLPQVTT